MAPTSREWLEEFAAALGTVAPTPAESSALLELAGLAAHTAERQAAPLACWLAARGGTDPEEALRLARHVSSRAGHATDG